MKRKVLIATIKSWNIENANNFIGKFKKDYDIRLITNKKELSIEFLNAFKPDYIFFPHWSWKIPREVYENYKCIVFHTSNLPEGRGGSPLQNQILRKEYESYVCAISVTEEYDQGDIYIKQGISLKQGSIAGILISISNTIFNEMIPKILCEDIIPKPQTGEASYYNRRTPEMSNLLNADIKNTRDLYDFIRMLDGEGYPKAFIKLGKCNIELVDANLENDILTGRFYVYGSE